jgi:hypothetical protein
MVGFLLFKVVDDAKKKNAHYSPNQLVSGCCKAALLFSRGNGREHKFVLRSKNMISFIIQTMKV